MLQAADNPTPFGQANIAAVKFPAAFADCPLGNYSECDSVTDIALAFLDVNFSTVLQPGYVMALEGNETNSTAGTL